MLQEGHEGSLVTGICAGRTNREMVYFNNISCNTVKDFAIEYSTSIFIKKEHYEEFNIKRNHY
jgi:hypothetical protein